jgi:hypothetical protein
MQKYPNVVQDRAGNAIVGALVTITNYGGGIATIYSDNGITVTNNPLVTDENGMYEFYAANGQYSLSATYGGSTVSIADITLFDVDDYSPSSGMVTYLPEGVGAVETTTEDKLRESVSIFDFLTDVEKDTIQSYGTVDITIGMQNAVNFSILNNRKLLAPNGNYTFGSITVGSVGSRGTCEIEGESYSANFSDTTTLNGVVFTLLDNTNSSMFVVPESNASDIGPGTVKFSNIWFRGNRSNQSGTSYAVSFNSHTLTANKQRAGYFENVRITNFLTGGIFGGQLRNAGIVNKTVILDCSSWAVLLGSNSDWRFNECDFGVCGIGLYLSGGGAVIATATNFFSNTTHGVKIDSTAGDASFFGCSIDRNGQDGLLLTGNGYPINFTGCRFTLNSASANNTYFDIRLIDVPNGIQMIGTLFEKDPASAVKPAYSIKTEGTTDNVIVVGSWFDLSNTPYATAFTNDFTKLIQDNDSIIHKNYRIDPDIAAINYVRLKGGTAFSPALVGCGGDVNAGLIIAAQTTGNVTIGRSANKLGFYDATVPRSLQTITGNRGGNAALADMITKLANMNLIVDSTTDAGGVGYTTGQGGAVVQATSKVTAFTLSNICGTIQFAADNLAANTTSAGAVWTNTLIGANDVIVLTHSSGGTLGGYSIAVTPAAGSATIYIRNNTSGALAEAPIFRFAIIKAAVT